MTQINPQAVVPVTTLDPRLEQLKNDLRNAPKQKEIVWHYLKLGVDPKYLANRYGYPVEALERAQKEFERRTQGTAEG